MKKVLKIVLKVLLSIIGAIALFYVCAFVYLTYDSYKIREKIRQAKKQDSLLLECIKKEAYENIKVGNIIAYEKAKDNYNIYGDIAYNKYGIYHISLNSNQLKRYKSVIKIMDSVILAKYGDDFFERIAKEKDSIYNAGWTNLFLDLDSVYNSASMRPKYQCDEQLFLDIEKKLLKYKILPWKKDSCCANGLRIDGVITKGGELINPRVLLKVDPVVDSMVVSLLKKHSCVWHPAVNWNEEKKEYEVVSCRVTFYFDLGRPNSWRYY